MGLFRAWWACPYHEGVTGTNGDTQPRKPRPRAARPPRQGGCFRQAVVVILGACLACVLGTAVLAVGWAAGAEFGPPSDQGFIEDLAVAYGVDAFLWPTPTPTAGPSLQRIVDPIALAVTATAFQPGAHYTETPTASSTPTASATPTPTETGTASETPTGSASPTVTASPSRTPTASRTMSPYRTWTPSRTPSRTSTRTATQTASPVPPTPTASDTWTPQPPTDTPGPGTVFPTDTPTSTPVPPTDTPIPPTDTPESTCTLTGNSGFENTLLGLINAERQNQGLRAYSMQGQLQAAARVHSADMACNSFISHTGSDGSGVRDRVGRQGYSWSWIGENIFSTGTTSSSAPQVAFDWWMNSAPHRANLMSPNYTEIGLGYRYNPDTRRGYFTAVFARP